MERKLITKIAPSLLSADFSVLRKDIKRAENAGADMFHLDVMDGHFVPNITFGPCVVQGMRKAARLPLATHLMIENPEEYVEAFAKAGSDMIIFHIEAIKNAEELVRKIKKLGKKAGVSLRPGTKAATLAALFPIVDEVLVMTVEPGFGGQKFMPDQLPKIDQIRSLYRGDIGVDGGVNYENAKLAASSGANVFVAGTYLFGSDNMKKIIKKLKSIEPNSQLLPSG